MNLISYPCSDFSYKKRLWVIGNGDWNNTAMHKANLCTSCYLPKSKYKQIYFLNIILTRQTVVAPAAPSFLPSPIHRHRQVNRAYWSLGCLLTLHSTENNIKNIWKESYFVFFCLVTVAGSLAKLSGSVPFRLPVLLKLVFLLGDDFHWRISYDFKCLANLSFHALQSLVMDRWDI